MRTIKRILLGSAIFGLAAVTLAGATTPVHAASTSSRSSSEPAREVYSYMAPATVTSTSTAESTSLPAGEQYICICLVGHRSSGAIFGVLDDMQLRLSLRALD